MLCPAAVLYRSCVTRPKEWRLLQLYGRRRRGTLSSAIGLLSRHPKIGGNRIAIIGKQFSFSSGEEYRWGIESPSPKTPRAFGAGGLK